MNLKQLSDLKSVVDGRSKRRIVVASAADKHSLGAVVNAAKDGIIEPVLIGDESEIKRLLKEESAPGDYTIIDEPDPSKAVRLAVQMVSSNEADVLMKGNVGTSTLLKAVLNKEWGLRTGQLLSHIALFEVSAYHKLIAVTDVALNIAPTLQDKIGIINNSVGCLNRLGNLNPKVALLGAVEMVNENMEATLDAALLSKMNQRGQIANCTIDGPLAFDNAVSRESAEHKNINSDVAGDADILIMPDIEAGNVLYKSLVFFARASVASVILGAAAPIVLTSRSDSGQTKYDSILFAAATS